MTTFSNQSKNTSSYSNGTKNTSSFTNQSKSTNLTGYAYNSSYAYNNASVEYNYVIGGITYSNQSKNASSYSNQSLNSSSWTNQVKS